LGLLVKGVRTGTNNLCILVLFSFGLFWFSFDWHFIKVLSIL